MSDVSAWSDIFKAQAVYLFMDRSKKMKVRVTMVAIVLMAVTFRSMGADWPQWQGPNRDGKSADTGLLKQWPENGPPLAWRIDS